MTALTAGAISLVSALANAINLSATAATGGTAPYTYQWYRSVVSGFTTGAGNLLSGQTSLTLSDTSLVPNTTYYYVLIATDSATPTPATVSYSQFTATTLSNILSQNQFAMASIQGMLDLKVGQASVVAAEVDVSETGTLYAAQPVRIVSSSDGIPKVIHCSANSDSVFGYIVYDIKSQGFKAGQRIELAQGGSCMYLYASGAITRGNQVISDVASIPNGGVKDFSSGTTGENIVGYAYDLAAAYGSLIRVVLRCPSFLSHT
jgi:hypothetical protein